MSLRDQRNKTREAILEGRFISHVLSQESKDLDQDIGSKVANFNSSFWADRNFSVHENTMTYVHLKQHRFVDMKVRDSARGRKSKVFHNVHNRLLFGHANEIVKELTVGFTDGVRDQMMQMDGTQL